MKNKQDNRIVNQDSTLFDRIVSILDEAKSNIVKAVNSNMVIAYWLIGREIVEEVQEGKKRAEYGKHVLKELSEKLTKKYGKGYSPANLANFKQFYLVFQDKEEIFYPVGRISEMEDTETQISYPVGRKLQITFNSNLSWSHYRALMRVSKKKARQFYEQETAESGWSKRELERHISSQYYERMIKNQTSENLLRDNRSLMRRTTLSTETLKNPYVLEFLDLPDSNILHETHLESAIITHLQKFLLELGKGFAFVGRQKRLQFENKDLYVDLVFYNCIEKFYLLIDLKIGEISYKDVGQMDGYVRMFDDLYTANNDNPTIGLILCTEKNEAVAKYSVLSERKQIFASKYMLYLPTEEELQIEIEKERRLIENNLK